MDYKKLLENYNTLLEEVIRLTEENSQLIAKLGLQEAKALALLGYLYSPVVRITSRNLKY